MTDPAPPDVERDSGAPPEQAPSELADTHDDLSNDLSIEERLSRLERLVEDLMHRGSPG